MAQKNVFSLIAKAFKALNDPENEELINEEAKNTLKINLVGILYFIIQSQMNIFVDFLISSPDTQLLITGLTENLYNGDQGLQIQIIELFKFMADFSQERRDEILDFFYDNILPMFLDHYNRLEKNEKFFSFVQQYIEFLVYCVKLHGYRSRTYLIQHKLLHTLYKGIALRQKSIDLALIRLVKSLVLSKDEFLLKYIANHNLLDDIFDIYVNNSRKDNLLSSSCLELFSIIQKEKIRRLIIHFGTRFNVRIEELGFANRFEKILADYELFTQNDKPIIVPSLETPQVLGQTPNGAEHPQDTLLV